MAMATGLISCGGEEAKNTSAQVDRAGPAKLAPPAGPGVGTRRLSRGGRPDPAAPPRPRGGVGVSAGAKCEQPELDPQPTNLATIAASTLCLINAERAGRGLGPLRRNANLDAAAIAHAADMVRRAYFEHQSPEGTDALARIKKTGYLRGVSSWAVGENLAWGTGALAQPRLIVNAWMNSPGHRANILRPDFDEIGFGIVIGNPSAPEGATYVNTFGGTGGGSATAEGDGEGEGEAAPAAAPPASTTRRGRAAARRRCARLQRASARKRCRVRAARRR